MSSLSTRLQNTIDSRLISATPIQTVKIQSPFRTGDFSRHTINIDSRFRDSPDSSTTCDFTYTLAKPISNVVRIRCLTEEIPNNYYFFTPRRNNITLAVMYGTGMGTRTVIQIDPGNYIASDMENELNTQLSSANIKWLTVTWDNVRGFFCFTGTQAFQIDTTEQTYDRQFDYGLGYYLGFARGIKGGVYDGSQYYTTCSDFYANFAGDNYLLMNLNNYANLQHSVNGDDMYFFGKIILQEPKNYMVFDDGAGGNIKEVVFNVPTQVTEFKIKVCNPYGEPIDFQNANISFTFEVVEIANLSVFNTIRDGMMNSFS
jgi:hypothetical protein